MPEASTERRRVVNARSPWLGVELRHIAALDAVAREGSFWGAAERLDYGQSAISQQLARLEGIVGARLIERRRGAAHVALTEAGELLLDHFDGIVCRMERAQADVEAMRAGRAGTLAVGLCELAAARLMPPILRALSRERPEIEVRMEESRDTTAVAGRVEAGELDLAFGDLPLPQGPFELLELVRDPYVLLVDAGSDLAGRGAAPRPEEMADLSLIGPGQERAAAAVEAELRSQGIEPRYGLRSESSAAVQALVAAGIGAAIVPRMSVDVSEPRTVALPLDGLLSPRVIVLYWHRERCRLPARDAFVEFASAATSS